jgi:hypothetical protein
LTFAIRGINCLYIDTSHRGKLILRESKRAARRSNLIAFGLGSSLMADRIP